MTSMKSRLFHARPWLVGALIAAALSPRAGGAYAESQDRVRGRLYWDRRQDQGRRAWQRGAAVRRHAKASVGHILDRRVASSQSKENIHAADEFASLRLAGARTDCRASYPIEEPDGRWVATFTFDCDEQTVQQIAVHTLPPIPVAFVREVPKFDDEPMSRDCSEYGRFRRGAGTIADVDLDSESVRLQPGWASPQPDRPGLFITHPAVRNAQIEQVRSNSPSTPSSMH